MIFQFHSYKSYLKAKITQNINVRGYQNQLASACGCQPSLLSRALNGEQHLTLDQGVCLCDFLELNHSEKEYFLTLLNYERSGLRKARNYFKSRLDELKDKARDIRNSIQVDRELNSNEQAFYYATPMVATIHMLCDIPFFQDEKHLAHATGLEPNDLLAVLTQLKEYNLVEHRDKRWIKTNKNIHLDKASAFVSIHHQNFRLKAMQNQYPAKKENMHITMLITLAQKDVEKIKDALRDAMKRVDSVIKDSPSQQLSCICLDFFSIKDQSSSIQR
jgi:uncharacterized protein (TIGR02147 family)